MRASVSRSLGRRRFLGRSAAFGSGVAALALAACGGGDSKSTSQSTATGTDPGGGAASAGGTPKRGGSISTEWQNTSNFWDPYRVSTGVVQHYSAIFDTLTTSNPKTLEIEPMLIEKWEEVEAGLRYILHVRKGVTWENKPPTNGRAFDAEDVVYNIKYAAGLLEPDKKGQIARSSWHRGVQSVTAMDANTVELKLSPANSAILAAMADMRQYAIPREIPEKMPFTDYAKFPSHGPFITKEYRDGETATYERNPNYWNKSLPNVDKAVIKWYGDIASVVAALLSGDVDVIRVQGGKPDVDQIQKSGKAVTLHSFPFRAFDGHYVNAERIPDVRIWKALHLVFDRQKAVDAVRGKGLWNYSGPVCSVLQGATPPDKVKQLPGYNPATRDADRTEAVAVLMAAGYPAGAGRSRAMLTASSSGAAFDLAVYHQADIKQAFPKIKYDIKPTPDPASFQRSLAARDYELMGGYGIYEALDARLAAENFRTKGSRNYGNYSNPQVNDLIDKAYTQPLAEALKTIGEIEKILFDASPLIVPDAFFESLGASNKVKGLPDRLGAGSGGSYNEVVKSRKFVWLDA